MSTIEREQTRTVTGADVLRHAAHAYMEGEYEWFHAAADGPGEDAHGRICPGFAIHRSVVAVRDDPNNFWRLRGEAIELLEPFGIGEGAGRVRLPEWNAVPGRSLNDVVWLFLEAANAE